MTGRRPAAAAMRRLRLKEPIWILPDWAFVERGEPIPPVESAKRRVEGELGAAALYLTPELAIHGTDRPELLGDAVSHGCIRMSNDDVLRLYEELEVGAPVIIHGERGASAGTPIPGEEVHR